MSSENVKHDTNDNKCCVCYNDQDNISFHFFAVLLTESIEYVHCVSEAWYYHANVIIKNVGSVGHAHFVAPVAP